jgi:hypothetical protein
VEYDKIFVIFESRIGCPSVFGQKTGNSPIPVLKKPGHTKSSKKKGFKCGTLRIVDGKFFKKASLFRKKFTDGQSNHGLAYFVVGRVGWMPREQSPSPKK